MTIIKDFISQYAVIIIYGVLTAIAGFLGTQLKKLYENRENEETKAKVVKTCVLATEQLYSDLAGNEKLKKCKENITAMLQNKGISISEIELDMLIESCIKEFNLTLFKEESE